MVVVVLATVAAAAADAAVAADFGNVNGNVVVTAVMVGVELLVDDGESVDVVVVVVAVVELG